MSVCAQTVCNSKPTGPTVVPMTDGEVLRVAVNPLWDLLQEWIDSQPLESNPSQVAKALGVSQSTFDTWQSPRELPTRRTLWLIHQLTRAPFKTVVDAAIEAVDLYNPARAEASAREYEARKEAKRLRPITSGEAGEVPPPRAG